MGMSLDRVFDIFKLRVLHELTVSLNDSLDYSAPSIY